ncbi:unnamed protein product [Toxocara canis]|uniref:Rod_C domain-containing protein n=1 Tax=Toxocara canis TaxID=6265 RepID=A0A183V3C9_TOXCA|nr:unnamed protein product [Toxocara canis]
MGLDKPHFARSLLSSGVRQNVELLHLIACIVIDYEVTDRKLIHGLLTKLCTARQREVVSRLLHLCRLYPSLARLSDLAVVWRDIAGWMHGEIDPESPSANQQLRRYAYFCLSFPAEARHTFDSLNAQMQSDGLLVGSQLLSIIISPAQKDIPIAMTVRERVEADVHLSWSDISNE